MDAVWKRTMLLTSNTMKISVFPIRIIQLYQKYISRSTRPDIFCKKGVLRNFTKFTVKHLCQSLFFNKVAVEVACNFTKKETLVQVFSCEFCKISKNTFFTEHWWLLQYMRIHDLIFRSIRQYVYWQYAYCSVHLWAQINPSLVVFTRNFIGYLSKEEKLKKWWSGVVKRLIWSGHLFIKNSTTLLVGTWYNRKGNSIVRFCYCKFLVISVLYVYLWFFYVDYLKQTFVGSSSTHEREGVNLRSQTLVTRGPYQQVGGV